MVWLIDPCPSLRIQGGHRQVVPGGPTTLRRAFCKDSDGRYARPNQAGLSSYDDSPGIIVVRRQSPWCRRTTTYVLVSSYDDTI